MDTAERLLRDKVIEECARVALDEKVSKKSARENKEDAAYNTACEHIAQAIRALSSIESKESAAGQIEGAQEQPVVERSGTPQSSGRPTAHPASTVPEEPRRDFFENRPLPDDHPDAIARGWGERPPLQEPSGMPEKEATELKDKILAAREQGNIVFWGLPGQLMGAKLDDFVEQPADGILYDLNRLEEISLTFLADPKWVNDFAVALTIRKLAEQRDSARGENKRILELHRGLMAEADKRLEAAEHRA